LGGRRKCPDEKLSLKVPVLPNAALKKATSLGVSAVVSGVCSRAGLSAVSSFLYLGQETESKVRKEDILKIDFTSRY
jgi:hypothetical protein